MVRHKYSMENLLTFDDYIFESNSIYKLDSDTKSKLLVLDEKYHKLIEKFRKKYSAQTVENIREEFKKFMAAKENGQKYFPKLEIKNSDFDNSIYEGFGKLIDEFEDIRDKCYIAKFYLEKIHAMRARLERLKQLDEGTYEPGENPVSKELYQQTLQCVKEHPYKRPDYDKDRTNESDDVLEKIEDALDDLGYDFDVKIFTGMLPRMNVKMNLVRINKTSKFSDEDIEGLIAHEIKGHVGRFFYGKKTGLWLFAYGLQSALDYDEGLAVWNSLNLVEHPKPNIMFNISIKTCISYLMYEMDFCDLFDWLKKQAPDMSDYAAFKTCIRPRRVNKDCEILSGGPMTMYFKGYNMVKEMDDQMRDDILHYNIGPDQKFELDNIKEFLKVNKFKPLK